MSILSLASGQSAFRGYEYLIQKKVEQMEPSGETAYTGTVSGRDGASYQVTIDTAHPRKSQCTCPHAAGRRVICKHMVALYFTAFPEEAERYDIELTEALRREEQEEQEQQEREEWVIDCVHRMKKAELQEALLTVLLDGPEWQYNRFIEEYLGDYDE